jgi:hypothetical protein
VARPDKGEAAAFADLCPSDCRERAGCCAPVTLAGDLAETTLSLPSRSGWTADAFKPGRLEKFGKPPLPCVGTDLDQTPPARGQKIPGTPAAMAR